ncbi:MAG: 5'-deoxyadenosine deaminase [Ignavibacteria bacterium]|nr:MAG: 5'-deoxyadenosine deaminase [Ignavibacteria bacterium]
MPIVVRAGKIVTGNANGDVIDDAGILTEGNRIAGIIPGREMGRFRPEEIVDAAELVAIPGFIQTHIHLCQTLFRGLADDLELLDWLRAKIFPLEAAHSQHSMHSSAMLGIAELIRGGTTTILDMGSMNHEEEVIRAVGEAGMRAFVGKAMMDVNDSYPKLKESTKASLASTRELAERWHNSYDGRIKYAVAPRFVLSCTDGLMKEAFEMTAGLEGALFHTHASENKREVKAVRERCKMDNVEYLDHLGLLSSKSCLAHCVHLNEKEVNLLKQTRANVAHCPSSNLKLASGIANIQHYVDEGINVALGADGAPCNNNLNMFQEMRLASLLQKPAHGAHAMPAARVFRMATLDGAKALGLDREIGSIEAGKKADLVLLDLGRVWDPVSGDSADALYSSIVYSAGPENVDSVMIDGTWVYRRGEFATLDQGAILHEGRKQLKDLLNRV